MNVWTTITRPIAICAVAALCFPVLSQAKKPDNPGGGGGGGGGSQVSYTLVPLPDADGNTDQIDFGYCWDVQELSDGSGGLAGVEVVGLLNDDAYYWALAPTGEVLDAIPLALPVGADPSTTSISAFGISGPGAIAGSVHTHDSVGNTLSLYPLLWPDALSDPVELPLFPGIEAYGRAFDINDNGLIVGIAYLAEGRRLVVWGVNAAGGIVGPEVLQQGSFISAPKLNNSGEVAATIDNTQGYRWQVSWNGESLSVASTVALFVDVGAGPVPLRVDSMNEYGDVCGIYASESTSRQGCILTAGGTVIDMPPLVNNKRQGTASRAAYDLTNAADPAQIQVIADAYVFDKRIGYTVRTSDVLWQVDHVTELTDVTQQPTTNLHFNTLDAISDAGWIVGSGRDSNGDAAPIVLVPN